jgi:hypothetical protein
MKRMLATVMLLGLITSSAFAATQSFFQAVTCANGYGGAYIITVVNTDFGCIDQQFGINCGGNSWNKVFSITARSADLGYTYSYMYSGNDSQGHPWYLKIAVDGDTPVKAWGQKGDGTYYEAVFQ